MPPGLEKPPQPAYRIKGEEQDWTPSLETTRERLFEAVAKGDELNDELRAALRMVEGSYASARSRYAPNPAQGPFAEAGPLDGSLHRIDSVLEHRPLWPLPPKDTLAPQHDVAPGASQCIRGCRVDGTGSYVTDIYLRMHDDELFILEVDAALDELVAVSKLLPVPPVTED